MGEATQSLLIDLFMDQTLFQGLPRIRKRVVAWGPGSQPTVLPHSALVISEHDLLDRLWSRVPKPIEESRDMADWEIISSRVENPGRDERRFGSRSAFVSNVQLKTDADRESCWAESLEDGWLFLFPVHGASACLISVGGSAPSLIEQSRLIAAQVETPITSAAEFPAYPRILSELCGPGWLACGTAAVAFDPLCGEGVANAVREAILASAVIRSAVQGSDVESLLAHYNSRLMSGFLRHLQMCHHYYSTGGTGPFWSSELQLLQVGIEWLSERLHPHPSPRYRLVGFELVSI
jgi:2-polyprenyl-6-methoxyphenol hydroxylase-like FAD-dependent oxidoreductase